MKDPHKVWQTLTKFDYPFLSYFIVLSQTLLTAPTKLGSFSCHPLLIDPTKVWETPLNFDDPICNEYLQITHVWLDF